MSTTLQRTLLKVIVLGDVGVGKTSLITRYVHQTFNEQYKATIGADFFTKELHIDGKVVSLQIWDTAGQERFNSLGPAFYRGADCCVLVFDVNVLKSFDSLLNWHEDFINQTNLSEDPTKFPFVVIGNKIDVNDGASRPVAEKRAKEWCTTIKLGATGSNSVPYFETSAKEGSNVENAFLGIAKSALSHERGQDIYFESITGSLPEIVEQQSGGCSC